jgi:hypothetical protein
VFPAGAKVGAVFSPDRRYAVVSAFLGQIPANQWQWEDDRRAPGRRVLVPVNPKKPPPPLVLHDLSSGTRVGQFPGAVPLSITNRQIGGMGTVRPLLVKPVRPIPPMAVFSGVSSRGGTSATLMSPFFPP